MAHGMTNRDSLVVAETSSWHGREKMVFPAGIPIGEALELSGLNWKVGFADETRCFFKQEDGTFHRLESSTKTVWRLPSEGQPDYIEFGAVGQDYTLIQNEVLFELAEKAYGSGLMVETAGSFFDGRRVYVTLRGETIGMRNDCSNRYLALMTGHDGKLSLTALPTNTRIVCQNTFNIAYNNAKNMKYSLRHTMRAEDQAREMQTALELYAKTGSLFAEQMNALDSVKLNTEKLYSFFTEQYAKLNPKVDLSKAEEMQSAKETIELWESTMASEMLELSENEPTLWLGANAITSWVQKNEPKRKADGWEDRRIWSTIDGDISMKTNKVFLDALELV